MRQRASARLAKIYWSLERLIDPGVVSSQYVYRDVLQSHVQPDTRWLDVGCGHSLFPSWIAGERELTEKSALTVGSDCTVDALARHSAITRVAAADLTALPFHHETFSLVTANMVVEHLPDPVTALREIARVLSPGGRFIFHTPNLWFYQVRMAAWLPQRIKNALIAFAERRHEAEVFRTFYRMNTTRDIAAVSVGTGLPLRTLRKVNTSAVSDIFLFGPFVVDALMIRRALRLEIFQDFRSNFIGVLQKT